MSNFLSKIMIREKLILCFKINKVRFYRKENSNQSLLIYFLEFYKIK